MVKVGVCVVGLLITLLAGGIRGLPTAEAEGEAQDHKGRIYCVLSPGKYVGLSEKDSGEPCVKAVVRDVIEGETIDVEPQQGHRRHLEPRPLLLLSAVAGRGTLGYPLREGGAMPYARPELLAEPDWLAEHADDPRVRVIDCAALEAYRRAHAP